MLADIKFSPFMMPFLMDFDEEMHKKAIQHIINVLKECHSLGHLQVAISYEDKDMYGYALWFISQNNDATYLHKIFVHEQYRNHKLGTGLLKSMCDRSNNIYLLCASDKIGFYERNSFKFIQIFDTPDHEDFKLSKGLYSELSVMSNSENPIEAPIFLLNDKDLRTIVGLK
jgi:GNAT superfamily N-acetyltransferase